MSEPNEQAPPALTAGALLRQARQARGLHIAALAAAIKVVPRKLELLESDQFDQLPDATFTRALAQTVCRTLKIDAAPVLKLLPPAGGGHRLDQVGGGLNTPFRERPGRLVPADWSNVTTPVLWAAALLLLGAGILYLLPAGWWPFSHLAAAPAASVAKAVPAAASAAPSSASAAPLVAPASAPASAVTGSAAASSVDSSDMLEPEALAAAAAAGVLQLHTSAQSWVEVTDASGQSLLTRVLQPGETVGLDGTLPLKLRIGNAGSTQVVFRGQPMELSAYTRDNVARLELK